MSRMIYRIIILITLLSLSANASSIRLSKLFTKTTLANIQRTYGDDGIAALRHLAIRYKTGAINKLSKIKSLYGSRGVNLFAKYSDEIVVKNYNNFKFISKYDDKGYYLLKQYPRSMSYYNKYGNKFMIAVDKYGNKKVISYLNDSAKYNMDNKVMLLLDKYGEKAVRFFESNWGKLLATGFTLLNSDEIINAIENTGIKTVKTTGNIITDSIDNIANSQLGLLIGIAFILFILFKYGFNKMMSLRNKNKESESK